MFSMEEKFPRLWRRSRTFVILAKLWTFFWNEALPVGMCCPEGGQCPLDIRLPDLNAFRMTSFAASDIWHVKGDIETTSVY